MNVMKGEIAVVDASERGSIVSRMSPSKSSCILIFSVKVTYVPCFYSVDLSSHCYIWGFGSL